MRYLALACDYDGTLATAGRVSAATLRALERLVASGRKLLLVTGRVLEDLSCCFPRLDLFERIVAENGAVLYRPASRAFRLLAEPPPALFLDALRKRKVSPLTWGKVIVATERPHEVAMLAAIRDLGLETHVIFNKRSVMALPSGVNKATGLAAALEELGLSPRNCVGVGDAENDHAFLHACECGVAVRNSVPLLRREADLVTRTPNGSGTRELVRRLVTGDLASAAPARRRVVIGTRRRGRPLSIEPYGVRILLAGQPGGGKSSAATAIVERIAAAGYQVCVLDPEGDTQSLADAFILGDARKAPRPDEAFEHLERPSAQVVLNLLAVRPEDRPAYFDALATRLASQTARLGHPHWLVLDEAHHLLWPEREPPAAFPGGFGSVLMVTVNPDQLPPAVLRAVDWLFVMGPEPGATFERFAAARGLPAPGRRWNPLERRQAYAWRVGERTTWVVEFPEHRSERRRHLRKYALGELAPEQSFYFRGPRGRLNLRAQNLAMFLQIADGVDDATWLHHLRRGDYSRWFRAAIKDDRLAREASAIERESLGARESRARLRRLLERRYTAPATRPALAPPARRRAPRAAGARAGDVS